jgi:hypothetical protein
LRAFCCNFSLPGLDKGGQGKLPARWKLFQGGLQSLAVLSGSSNKFY